LPVRGTAARVLGGRASDCGAPLVLETTFVGAARMRWPFEQNIMFFLSLFSHTYEIRARYFVEESGSTNVYVRARPPRTFGY
jgi:hypothetical protein